MRPVFWLFSDRFEWASIKEEQINDPTIKLVTDDAKDVGGSTDGICEDPSTYYCSTINECIPLDDVCPEK